MDVYNCGQIGVCVHRRVLHIHARKQDTDVIARRRAPLFVCCTSLSNKKKSKVKKRHWCVCYRRIGPSMWNTAHTCSTQNPLCFLSAWAVDTLLVRTVHVQILGGVWRSTQGSAWTLVDLGGRWNLCHTDPHGPPLSAGFLNRCIHFCHYMRSYNMSYELICFKHTESFTTLDVALYNYKITC